MRWFLTTALTIAAVTLLCGCPPTTTSGTKPTTHSEDEEKPPHDGQLFATGDHKFHVELVVNKKVGSAEVYLLDDHVKEYIRTKADALTLTLKGTPPKVVTFKPEPQKDDPMGQSSRFTATDPLLTGDLKDAEINVKVNDKPYSFKPE
jgi:hypothetical protein